MHQYFLHDFFEYSIQIFLLELLFRMQYYCFYNYNIRLIWLTIVWYFYPNLVYCIEAFGLFVIYNYLSFADYTVHFMVYLQRYNFELEFYNHFEDIFALKKVDYYWFYLFNCISCQYSVLEYFSLFEASNALYNFHLSVLWLWVRLILK